MLPDQELLDYLSPAEQAELDALIAAEEQYERIPRPQPGPQSQFLECDADIVIYGGAAGGGKTAGLFLEAMKDRNNPYARFVYFRREQTQITKAGGPWDKSREFFPYFGAVQNMTSYKWKFPSGYEGQFASLQYDADVLAWQTAEVPLILWDELNHFSEYQFWYLLSRNRSTSGAKCRVRAGTNPGPGWVKRLLAPWINPRYHVQALPGEKLYLARIDGEMVYVDAEWRYPTGDKPKTITFIPSSVYDNQILMDKNPDYITSLLTLPPVEMRRLLYSDWEASDGSFFEAWNEATHARTLPFSAGEQPREWNYFGGMDWGYGSPFAFVLCSVDPDNCVRVIAEIHETQKTGPQQASLVLSKLNYWGIKREDCTIYSDPRMFEAVKRGDKVGEADIEDFQRAGLVCVPGNNRRETGWGTIRKRLILPDGFFVAKGHCPKLITLFPEMRTDKDNPNDMDTTGDDHLHDALRYAMHTRVEASPRDHKKFQWIRDLIPDRKNNYA